MKARLVSIVACVSCLTAGALARADGVPRVDQRPHRVEYDPSKVGVLKQPLALSKLDPKKAHTIFFKSRTRPERMYARDPATGKTLAESAAYHQHKDAEGNTIYVSKLGLKAFTPDAELIVQLSTTKLRWAMLLLCDAIVTTGGDSGAGSLRDGIANVRNGGSVCFDPAVFDVPSAPQVALAGEILVGKNVDVHGTETLPTIGAGGGDRALQFGLATESTMDDLTLRDGDAARGGLILNRGNLSLDNVRLGLSHADDGGAIYNDGGRLTLRDCSVSGNDATRGGGLFNDDGEVLMFATSVSHNDAEQGGGLFIVNGDLLMHDGSYVQGNEAVEGGGMYLQDASFHGNNYLYGGVVSGNVAERGGGIFLDGGGLVIEFVGGRSESAGQAVDSNLAYQDGGGVYVTVAGTVEVKTGNHVARNGAIGRGGGIYNLGHVILREGSGVDHGLADAGGGVYNDGLLELHDTSRIGDNGAYHSGGGVYNTTNAELHAWHRDARIENNDAVLGGGSGAGGGVANFGQGVVDVLSTVIVGNRPNDLVNLP